MNNLLQQVMDNFEIPLFAMRVGKSRGWLANKITYFAALK